MRTSHKHHIDVVGRHRYGQYVPRPKPAKRLKRFKGLDQFGCSCRTRTTEKFFRAEHIDVVLKGTPSVGVTQKLSELWVETMAQMTLKPSQMILGCCHFGQCVLPDAINVDLGNLVLDEVGYHQFALPVQSRLLLQTMCRLKPDAVLHDEMGKERPLSSATDFRFGRRIQPVDATH